MPDRYRRDNERGYAGDSRYSEQTRNGSYEDRRYAQREYSRQNAPQRRSYDNYRPGSRNYDDYRPASRTSDYRGDTGYRAVRQTEEKRTYYSQPKTENRGIGKKMIIVFILFTVVIGNFILFAVLDSIGKEDKGSDEPIVLSGADFIEEPAVSETETTEMKAEKLLADMTTEEKVGQLLLIRSNGRDTQEFSELISQCKVGGIVLFKSDFEGKTKQGVIDMNAAFQTAGGGKLLICVDEEGGTVVRMSGLSELRSEKYKSPQSLYKLGGFEEIRNDTINKCEFLKTYGVNVNFAPVADVVTESSAFMYKRAFGKNAEDTGEYVKTVVTAMKENKVGSSIKHFPGYGNSKGDTHEGLDHNKNSLGALKASDLVPFKYGVEAGADSIMVTHTIIDDVDAENPASLSTECIALIREYLGFEGVILTDALDMGAIIEFCDGEDPCVQAFCAGIDMLCLPSDPKEAYTNLLNAVNEGKISQERLDESVERILVWKINLGLYDE